MERSSVSLACARGINFRGNGTFSWPNGDLFEGQYKNDMRNGKSRRTGVNDLGYGVFKGQNLDVFRGEFVNDRKNGK